MQFAQQKTMSCMYTYIHTYTYKLIYKSIYPNKKPTILKRNIKSSILVELENSAQISRLCDLAKRVFFGQGFIVSNLEVTHITGETNTKLTPANRQQGAPTGESTTTTIHLRRRRRRLPFSL